MQLRKSVLSSARRVVVKMGSQLLTDDRGRLDKGFLKSIAGQIASLRARRFEITVVSSGAVAAGCAELGLSQRPRYIADQQAVAAVGQRRLMTHMHEVFAPHGLEVAQVLLTRADFEDRVRYLNIRNCITRLHRLGCVPILNENDTVAVEELGFGDNDMLAALTCNALRADALVLLTNVAGLLDRSGSVIDMVRDVSGVVRLASGAVSRSGKGGMATKLEAARIVTAAGELAVIAHGREPRVLERLFDAEPLGTVFVPAARKLASRRRWIGIAKRPAGSVIVDDGAAEALRSRGTSLLAIGIMDAVGQFQRGQVVAICDRRQRPIARGLSNYAADEIRRIMGKRSNQFEKILGRPAHAVVIHRDHLVLVQTG